MCRRMLFLRFFGHFLAFLIALLSPCLITIADSRRLQDFLLFFLGPLNVGLWSERALSLMLQLSFELFLLLAGKLLVLPLLMVLVQSAEPCERVAASRSEIAALRDGAIQGVVHSSGLLE